VFSESLIEQKSFKSRFKNRQRITDSDYCERLRVRVLLVMMTLSDNDCDNDETCYVL